MEVGYLSFLVRFILEGTMKHSISFFSILIFGLLCAACTGETEPSPTELPAAITSPDFTSTSESSATATPTATITPTPTPLPPVFVREGTPPIQPQEPISVDNAYRIQELARWGYGAINEVEHSKDGQLMYVQTSMGVYAYRAGTLDEVWRYEVGAGASAFDVGSQYLAVGTYSGEIILLDATNGSEVYAWEAHSGEVLDVEFSADDTLLVSGSDDNYMRLWEMKPGPAISIKLEIIGDYQIDEVFFCGETNSIVILSIGDDYKLIDAESGEVLRVGWGVFSPEQDLYIYNGVFRRISDNSFISEISDQTFDEIYAKGFDHSFAHSPGEAFSNNGTMYAFGGVGQVAVVSITDGSLIAFFEIEPYYSYSNAGGHLAKPTLRSGPVPYGIFSLNFSTDDRNLVATNGFGNSFVLDLEKESVKTIVKQRFGETFFSPAGKHIITVSMDGLEIHEISIGEQVGGISDGWVDFYGFGPRIFFSPEITHLGMGSQLWKLDEGKRKDLPEGETILGFIGDGPRIFTLRRQWWVVQRQISDLSIIKQVQLEWVEENIEDVLEWNDLTWWELTGWGISPDGSMIRAGAYTTPYLVWDLDTGKFLWSVGLSTIHHSAYSNDGRYLAEESVCNVVVRERQTDGVYEQIFQVNDVDIGSCPVGFVFSRMNRLYIAGYKTIEIFDPATRASVDSVHLGSENYERRLAISPDESLLAVTSGKKIIIWDMNDEKLLVEFDAHLLDILDLTFSPDGRYLATSSWDGTVRLWGIVP
jgi:WD40 repeat protein